MRRSAVLGFVGGVAFFGPLVVWVHLFGLLAWVGWTTALSLSWALAGLLVSGIRRLGVRSVWVVPTVWSLVELGRERWPFGGTSWGGAGYALHSVPAARAGAAFVGVIGVGFIVIAVNTCLGEGITIALRGRHADRPFRSPLRRPFQLTAGISVALLGLGVAAHALAPEPRPTGILRIAMLQGNDRNRDLTDEEILHRYLLRSHLDLAAKVRGPVDLVVFPESAIDADPWHDPQIRNLLGGVARRLSASVIANTRVWAARGGKELNVNFFIDPRGRLSRQWYAKTKIVPFGEFVPFRGFLVPLVRALNAVPVDLARGSGRQPFVVAGRQVATMICFEVGFPTISRNAAREGAELLVVTTNNRSFGRSPNVRQQLAMAQFRAAETHRFVLQDGISGITAVINPRGEVVEQVPIFERRVLQANVETYRGRTVYVALGEWLPLSAGAFLLGAVLIRGRHLRRHRAS